MPKTSHLNKPIIRTIDTGEGMFSPLNHHEAMEYLIGNETVRVAKNLNIGGLFSVSAYRENAHGKKSWRVVFYTDAITLEDCTFPIHKGGQSRCRREKSKNVHAWIQGRLSTKCIYDLAPDFITYNPYKFDGFVWSINEEPIEHADVVDLYQDCRTMASNDEVNRASVQPWQKPVEVCG